MLLAQTILHKLPELRRALEGVLATPAARGAARAAMNVFFPPSCVNCRRGAETDGVLCASCWAQVRFIERPFCERLGTPFPVDLGEGVLSPEAIADPPFYARARAVARFEDGPV